MEESTSREKILKKIRNALISSTDTPYASIDQDADVFSRTDDPLEIQFATALNSAAGKFIYCENEGEFVHKIQYLIKDKNWESLYCGEPRIAELFRQGSIPFETGHEKIRTTRAGVTQCEFLIARLGSVLVSSAQLSGRRSFAYPDTHIVLGYTSQLVSDIKDALKEMKVKYQNGLPSMISLITGPSRTADIEKTLVMGAHGPKELFVFLVEDKI
jgi:L-lactate dehydrogenase complex protein LldG